MGKWDAILQSNNDTLHDWITWETLGNPSENYQKGNTLRFFGLWRADYELMAKEGKSYPQADHADGALGRGYLKVYVLDEYDYREHKELIETFLPCMSVDKLSGHVVDPLSSKVARQTIEKPYVVFPYNYDDNGPNSRALGTKLGELEHLGAVKLAAALPRWSTASRSCIVPFAPSPLDVTTLAPKPKVVSKHITPPDWPHRERGKEEASIFGDVEGGQADTFAKWNAKGGVKFYSVKTGVQFVGKQDQSGSDKDYLESGSVQAMNRSNLVAWVRSAYGREALVTRYQIEMLLVIANRGDRWDGMQVRDLGPTAGETWFPATSIPNQGQSLFAKLKRDNVTWDVFWEEHFAKPLGRAKAEMLTLFGMQLQGNAQNMLVAFNQADPTKSQLVVRDIGDALLNDYFYATLSQSNAAFQRVWDLEGDPGAKVSTTEQETQNDALPLMTRIGTNLLFFFPPFVQGDVTLPITARWALSSHDAYLDYMKNSIGYVFDGASTSGTDAVDLEKSLTDFADETKLPGYKKLVKDVLASKSSTRRALFDKLQKACRDLITADSKDAKTFRRLVAAQELLIGADLQNYVSSADGKKALLKFHTTNYNSRAVVLWEPPKT